uniref:Sushi domain-containing protein n=1 Tax=Branchiostoma floridae TaxID=7739 RepID=C3XPY7_BRAFL|eukprot:XP_002613999.1 hypothetical protein BRAFLDRAFT_67419 [Branchiostoma floridae]
MSAALGPFFRPHHSCHSSVHRVFVLLLMTELVLESGAWWRQHRSVPPPPPKECSTPPSPDYTIKSCVYPHIHGHPCTYRCQPGYTPFAGSITRTCSNGVWTGTDLVCKRDYSSPQTPDYTFRSGCGYPYTQGKRCTYRCLLGYTQVSGSTTKTCYNGHWTSTGDDLVCRRVHPYVMAEGLVAVSAE